MLHHVALEIREEDEPAEGNFWLAAGFNRVSAPEELGHGYTWFEREGTQIHLIATDSPVIPSTGHVAVVARDFQETVERLRQAGFEAVEGRRLWGERRAKARTPSGHTVELMAAPPHAGTDS